MKPLPSYLLWLIGALTFALEMPVNAQESRLQQQYDFPGIFRFNDPPQRFGTEQMSAETFRDGKKWGLRWTTGLVVQSAIYDSISNFAGLFLLKKQGLWGWCNEQGELKVPCTYTRIEVNYDSTCFVFQQRKQGLLSFDGELLVPVQYDSIYNMGSKHAGIQQNKRWAIYAKGKKQIAEFKFDELRRFEEGFAFVRQGELWGFVNEAGILLVRPSYDAVNDFENGRARVYRFGLGWGVINSSGDEILPLKYGYMLPLQEGRIAHQPDLLWGYLDEQGREVIPPQFRDARSFIQGFAVVQNDQDKYGLIDKQGKLVIPFLYDQMGDQFVEEFIRVQRGGNWGYCNKKGEEVIRCRYAEAEDFNNGFAYVSNGDGFVINTKGEFVRSSDPGATLDDSELNWRVEYMDTSGQVRIRGQQGQRSHIFIGGYALTQVKPGAWNFLQPDGQLWNPTHVDSAGIFSEGVVAIKMGSKWGYMYSDKQWLIEPKFEYASNFLRGLALIRENGYYGYINKVGQVVVPCRYEMAYAFREGLALVSRGNRYGFINREGVEVVACKFEDALPFSAGLAPVRVGKLWGYINSSGVQVIAPQFQEAYAFRDSLAPVRLAGKMGYINRKGEWHIRPTYLDASPFYDGAAIIQLGESQYTLIDLYGRRLTDSVYTFIEPFFEQKAIVNSREKKGMINTKGRVVLRCIYDDLSPFYEGYALAAQDRKYGVIDQRGVAVIPLKYRMALFFSEGLAPVWNSD